jgi:two-component system, OmpR family, sensor histidine kinase ArlS
MGLRWTSLRTRVLALGLTFSVLIVGAILVMTYFVVINGISGVASNSSLRLAAKAVKVVDQQWGRVWAQVKAEGLTGPAASEAALDRMLTAIPGRLKVGLFEGVGWVFYDSQGAVVSSSSAEAVTTTRPFQKVREQALITEQAQPSRTQDFVSLSGLYQRLNLGLFITHEPVSLPGGVSGVLDVIYRPTTEETIVDQLRLPMSLLAITAMLFAIALVEVAMTWILKLVEDLRLAADAIDADQLDVRLPEYGRHEIGDLAVSLNGLLERLRRRADAQTRFVADASHELATPVAGVRGYVGILRAWGGEDPEVREEAIDAIDRESKRMVRLCGELLAVIRSENIGDVKSETCDVNVLGRDALASTATRYLSKRLEFTGPDEESLVIVSDPGRLDQLLSILLDNAAKYTPDGGSVRLTTRPSKDGVLIDVSDTGIGIPAADLPNIFDRFYRSDDSRCQDTGGFGLGLSIAHRVVEALGGTIAVSSVVAEGTTFTVSLPRRRPTGTVA